MHNFFPLYLVTILVFFRIEDVSCKLLSLSDAITPYTGDSPLSAHKIKFYEEWLVQHGKIFTNQSIVKQLADYEVCCMHSYVCLMFNVCGMVRYSYMMSF